jgi:hypothetical protein
MSSTTTATSHTTKRIFQRDDCFSRLRRMFPVHSHRVLSARHDAAKNIAILASFSPEMIGRRDSAP